MLSFYSNQGKWPDRLKDLNLSEKKMTSSQIDKLSLKKEGTIYCELNKKLGENKQLILLPKSIMSGTNFEWQCYTNFTAEQLTYPGMSQPLCVSRKLK